MALLSFLGFDTLLLGFDKNDLALVRGGTRATLQKAKEHGIHGGNKVTQATLGWNLAIARLAAGESQEIDPEVFRQLSESGDIGLFVSGFTDLAILEKYYPYLHPGNNCRAAVEQAKQRLVAAFPPQDLETIPTRPLPSRLAMTSTPGSLTSWSRRIPWNGAAYFPSLPRRSG